jgi:DNA-binding transcriptional LysR family regulator
MKRAMPTQSAAGPTDALDARHSQALCFAAVAEHASFTRAALRLGCSKAHVSKQVVALERALGVQLLLRSTRRLVLTEAGHVYLDYCRQAREALQEGERAVSAGHGAVAGRLHLSVPTSMGEPLVLDLLLDLKARHPELDVDLDLSVQHRDLIGDSIDFALRTSHHLDEHLVARRLGTVDNVLVASAAFLARHRLQDIADLARVPCLLNPHLRDEPEWTLQDDAGPQVVQVNGWLQANHFGLLCSAALRGAGVARLPCFVAARALAEGRLQRVLPNWHCPPTPLYLVYPQRRHMPLRHQVFRDFVSAWFADPKQAPLLTLPPDAQGRHSSQASPSRK